VVKISPEWVTGLEQGKSGGRIELDIENKLRNFLKIAGILNDVFRPQKPLRKQEKITQYTGRPSSVIWQRNVDY
jgi:hypothetical protein